MIDRHLHECQKNYTACVMAGVGATYSFTKAPSLHLRQAPLQPQGSAQVDHRPRCPCPSKAVAMCSIAALSAAYVICGCPVLVHRCKALNDLRVSTCTSLHQCIPSRCLSQASFNIFRVLTFILFLKLLSGPWPGARVHIQPFVFIALAGFRHQHLLTHTLHSFVRVSLRVERDHMAEEEELNNSNELSLACARKRFVIPRRVCMSAIAES